LPSDEGEPAYVDEAPEARKKALIRQLKREREAKATPEARQARSNRASGKAAAHAGHAVDDQNEAPRTPAPTAGKKTDTLDLFNDTK
jgi:hypothetical protein